MSKTFFVKKNTKESSERPYSKLLRQNEIDTAKTRDMQASEVLRRLKENIGNRIEKLNGLIMFIEDQQKVCQQLTEQYEQKPTPALAKKINNLQEAINNFQKKLEKSQSEKVIADLRSEYDLLSAELARKEALLSQAGNPESPSIAP